MKKQKCKLKVVFQAENEETMLFAYRYVIREVRRIANLTNVDAYIDIPDELFEKIYRKSKS